MDKLTREWLESMKQKGVGELAIEAKRNPDYFIKIEIDSYCAYVPLIYSAIPYENKTKTRAGYVYIITDGEYVKIGQATNIEKRLASLQCGNPRKLSILQTIQTDDMNLTEHSLHWWFKDYRIQGEWFDLASVFLNQRDNVSDFLKRKIERAKTRRALISA